jgi:hypothetical protein
MFGNDILNAFVLFHKGEEFPGNTSNLLYVLNWKIHICIPL